MILLLLACRLNEPIVISHRALGGDGGGEENLPGPALGLLAEGFGVELDVRLDGDGCGGDPSRALLEGCFDLGHTSPNGHTLDELVPLIADIEHEGPPPPLLIDIVNDPERAVSTQILPYLAANLPSGYPVLVQSSSVSSVAMLTVSRADLAVDTDIRVGVTYFADPEFTVPDFVDLVVVNIAELPPAPMPVPVAAYGVASASSWKSALYASSDVEWVITDFPTRAAAFTP